MNEQSVRILDVPETKDPVGRGADIGQRRADLANHLSESAAR